MNIDDRGIRTDRPKDEEQVWHVIRLKNTGTQPWTTAPAFTMNNDLPVAQDTLSYTPPGGQSTLKLTVSSDVHGEQNQTETARRQTQIANRNYDEVTVSGKLSITNWKDKEIAMVVHKSLVGEVLDSPDGTATKVARNLAAVNPTSEIQWEFKLPAGQTRELTYQVQGTVDSLIHGRRRLDQRLDGFGDARGVNAVFGQELLGLAGVREFADGELVDFDAIDAQFPGNSVAQTAFGIMILDGQHEIVRFFGRRP